MARTGSSFITFSYAMIKDYISIEPLKQKFKHAILIGICFV